MLEYCSGGTLSDRIKRGQLYGAKDFRDIAIQLLEALAHCHSKRIAHLDIKPENIFFTADGRVRLADFGCSKQCANQFVGGSLPFMAPEVLCRIDGLDPFRADIWSLGICFYYMVAGKLPWKASDFNRMSSEIRLGLYQPLVDVDQRIPPIIQKTLKLEPRQRASVGELIEILNGWRIGTPVALKVPLNPIGSHRSRRSSKSGPTSPTCGSSLSFAGFGSSNDFEPETPLSCEKE
jgi:[calcium/calmodulin-dependent protein kinase] kinase